MVMRPIEFNGTNPVDGYGPGYFRVAGRIVQGAVLVSEAAVTPWGGVADTAPLLALAGRIDVIFMGMGAEIAHPPRELVAALEQVGIMVEPMASPTAARTYNVTLSEGRRVACALLPV